METAVNNAKSQAVKSDRGDVQKHVDADGSHLPYQAHFSHVKVSHGLDAANIPSQIS